MEKEKCVSKSTVYEVSMINLSATYAQIKDKLDTIAFHELWPGFRRYDFALYNDTQVVLNDEILPKTDEFLANTAILYKGKYTAIWYLTEETDIEILTSKIVHEMFHAYQTEHKESRFPNELEALLKYEYSPEYLNIKYQENVLLASLCKSYDGAKFEEFLSLRKRRKTQFPYQYNYECSVEVIEGSAQYVELKVLNTFSHEKYMKAQDRCLQRIRDINNLMPVRISCYDTGAMLLKVCLENSLTVNTSVGKSTEYLLIDAIFDNIQGSTQIFADSEIDDFYHAGIGAFRNKIDLIVEGCKPIVEGEFDLIGVNVYSAQYLDGYIYTEYLLIYKADEPITLYGNYLLKMKHNKITAIYMDSQNK